MDVGLNLRELRSRGQLAVFARALGVNEHEAIGVLADAWSETQDREICACTAEVFANATALRFDDPGKVLTAMVRAQLAAPVETPDAGLGPTQHWLIKGNERHVDKLQKFRASAAIGGRASAAKRANGKRTASERLANGNRSLENHDRVQANAQPFGKRTASALEPVSNQSRTLVTGNTEYGDRDLRAPAPNLSQPTHTEDHPRSSLSSDCKSEIVLSASPSAAADALAVLELPKPKGKQRSADQKRRSVGNARLYCELYENAEKHPPSGLDASFYGMMAKFSDKHAENTETILRWVFASPDTFFRSKGWPLELIIAQAPKLWREANNPRAVVENIAAPRQQQQMALAASNDLAFEEYQRRKAERLANANQV